MAGKNIDKKGNTQVIVKEPEKQQAPHSGGGLPTIFTPRLVGMLADEIAKTMMTRFPNPLAATQGKKKKPSPKKAKRIEYGIFLDTSAIIDGRIFDVIHLGLLYSHTPAL